MGNYTKLISVCLATYNGEKYLRKQLDSLVNQTYKNFELIVQDDCSSDQTVEVLNSYKDKLNIEVYQNDKNIGYIKNFETVLKRAQGDFIAMCDQDDVWELNKLELLMTNIGSSTLIYSDSLLIDENGNSLGKKFSESLKNNFITTSNPLSFLNDNCVSAHAMLFKKELLKYIFPFPENVFFDAWIAANAASVEGVVFYDKCLVNYRQHSSNTLSKHTNKSKSKNLIKNKAMKKLQATETKIDAITSFLKIPLLQEDDKNLIINMRDEYMLFEKSWFNFSLFQILLNNKDKLFPITKKNRFRLILKQSFGFKLYKMLPFL